MPVRHTRPNVFTQLSRYDDSRLEQIATETVSLLASWSDYAFTGDELAARIDTPATGGVVEHALTMYTDDAEYRIHDEQLYWWATDHS